VRQFHRFGERLRHYGVVEGQVQIFDGFHQVSRGFLLAQDDDGASLFPGNALDCTDQWPTKFRTLHAKHIAEGVLQMHSHQWIV
jgi:hypothetical protein